MVKSYLTTKFYLLFFNSVLLYLKKTKQTNKQKNPAFLFLACIWKGMRGELLERGSQMERAEYESRRD